MRRIAVLGSSLAGICATTALEQQLEGRRHVELTHVSESTHAVYRPLLPHVVSGALETTALSVPLEDVFASSTEIVVERIRHIDPDDRVIAGEARDIPFDYLIVAPPTVTDWGGHPEWRHRVQPFETLGDAADVRQLLTDARQHETAAPPSADPTDDDERIVIVGASANGLELAFEVEWALDRASPAEKSPPEIAVVDRAAEPLPGRPKPLRDACRDRLHERGIHFRGGREVTACNTDGIELDDGEYIPAQSRLEASVFWCGGVRPPGFLHDDAFAVDEAGRLVVDEYLSLREHYGIYAAGPVVASDSTAPSTASTAVEQGENAAGNLLAELSGRTPSPFEIGPPSWALSLGPDAAAVYRNGAVISGAAGWTLYRVLHTSLIPGSLKKVGLLRAWIQEGIRRASD